MMYFKLSIDCYYKTVRETESIPYCFERVIVAQTPP